jgi:hypothetical protein
MAVEGAHLHPSKQEESGDYMKLWKGDPYMPGNKGLAFVVVMAETRQQAIEKGGAKLYQLGTEAFRALGHRFPDEDYRRFAELGSDNLENTLEEVPEEVMFILVPPSSVELPGDGPV